jgi:branched-chain amino acid aminotransferase
VNYNCRMASPLVYLNGQFLPEPEARLSIQDAGLTWGVTVTDRCRTFRHQLFRLADHLRRFRNSCQQAKVPQPLADSELAAIAHHVVEENAKLIPGAHDLALVLFATPGPIAATPAEKSPPTLCIYTAPLPFLQYARLFREGARLDTPTVRQVPSNCIPPTVKHRSRLHWWLAEQEVRAANPEATALLLDVQGHVTETASANFLLVREGHVLTPRAGTVLPGVSLHVVADLCSHLGILFTETDLTLRDCARAEEAMLSCTSFCLAPVAQLNETMYTRPGPVFERLLAAWSDRVGLDIRAQALEHVPA